MYLLSADGALLVLADCVAAKVGLAKTLDP
jgi:hypothetical protein